MATAVALDELCAKRTLVILGCNLPVINDHLGGNYWPDFALERWGFYAVWAIDTRVD